MTNEELVMVIKGGNDELAPSLWERVERFAYVKATDYYYSHPELCTRAGVTLEDLKQEAYFAFMAAVNYYDPEKGFLFLSFMTYPLQQAFNGVCGMRTKKRRMEPINNARSLSSPVGEDDLTLEDTIEDEGAVGEFRRVEEAVYQRQLHETLEECLSTLPEIQAAAVRCRHYEGLSLEETGERLGLSGSQSRSQEEKGLRALRYGKNRKRLEPFREDIISTHAYKSSFSLWKSTGMSSTEYTVLKLEQGQLY